MGEKGRRDVEVFSSAARAALGKLLNETGYFPAKPRITYIFFFVVGGKWVFENGPGTGFLPSDSRSSGGAPAAVRGKPFATKTPRKKKAAFHYRTKDTQKAVSE